jgi:hypothetical protein
MATTQLISHRIGACGVFPPWFTALFSCVKMMSSQWNCCLSDVWPPYTFKGISLMLERHLDTYITLLSGFTPMFLAYNLQFHCGPISELAVHVYKPNSQSGFWFHVVGCALPPSWYFGSVLTIFNSLKLKLPCSPLSSQSVYSSYVQERATKIVA